MEAPGPRAKRGPTRSSRLSRLWLPAMALCAAAGLLSSVRWSPSGAVRADATALRNSAPLPIATDDSTQQLLPRALIIPVVGVPRSGLHASFYERRGANLHEALDIAAPRGTQVVAAGDGRIVKLFTSVPGGLTVYQLDTDEKFAYYYAHLDGYADSLKEGMTVKRGEVLGYVGTTGNAPPNAPHLHFAIFRLGAEKRWWKGTPIDPYPLLNEPER